MSSFQLDRLQRQNAKLQQRSKQLQTQLHCLKNDNKTLCALNKSQQNQISGLKRQIQELKGRIADEHCEKEATQSHYLSTFRRVEEELEEAKQKYARMQCKILPLLDHDTVRLKVLNEVESAHQLQIVTQKRMAERVQQENYKLKTQVELMRCKWENVKGQLEDVQRNNTIRNIVQKQNYASVAMSREIEEMFRKNYQDVKKQANYYKQKYFINQKKLQNVIKQQKQ